MSWMNNIQMFFDCITIGLKAIRPWTWKIYRKSSFLSNECLLILFTIIRRFRRRWTSLFVFQTFDMGCDKHMLYWNRDPPAIFLTTIWSDLHWLFFMLCSYKTFVSLTILCMTCFWCGPSLSFLSIKRLMICLNDSSEAGVIGSWLTRSFI